jgi:hypothetical protein
LGQSLADIVRITDFATSLLHFVRLSEGIGGSSREGRAFQTRALLPFPSHSTTITTATSTSQCSLSQFQAIHPAGSQYSNSATDPTMAPSLTKQDFESNLYKAFLDDATLPDVTIHLSDRAVRVHKIVLCRQSEYFTKLLTGQFQVCLQ